MNPDDISRKRKMLELTQEQLAEKIGVSTTTIYRWETGSAVPSIGNHQCLKEILNGSNDAISQFEKLLLNQNLPVAIFDLHCTYIAANPNFNQLLNHRISQIFGLKVEDLFPEILSTVKINFGDHFRYSIRRRTKLLRLVTGPQQSGRPALSHRIELIRQSGFVSRYIHEIC